MIKLGIFTRQKRLSKSITKEKKDALFTECLFVLMSLLTTVIYFLTVKHWDKWFAFFIGQSITITAFVVAYKIHFHYLGASNTKKIVSSFFLAEMSKLGIVLLGLFASTLLVDKSLYVLTVVAFIYSYILHIVVYANAPQIRSKMI